MMAPRRLAGALLLLAGGVLSSSAAALDLTPLEAAGKRLYREGIGLDGRRLSARIGDQAVVLPGSAVACVNCHGADARGRPEGGLQPPEITWRELAKPYGHRHAQGREHPPFTAAAFYRAVSEGLDPAGQRLHPAMPRYALAQREAEALIAYLQRVGEDHDPGIGAEVLRIGTLLPASGPLADAAQLVGKVVRGVFERVNAEGGVHGRRLELVVLEGTGTTPLVDRLRQADVLALVSPLLPGAEEALAAAAEAAALPVVGAQGARRGEDGRFVFTLASGEREQARALADFAVRRLALADSEIALVLPAGDTELAPALETQLAHHGWRRVERRRSGPEAERALAEWRARGVPLLFFFGTPEDFAQLQRSAVAAGWQPAVLAPANSVGRSVSGNQEGFQRLFVAAPVLPVQGKAAGRAAFDELRRRQNLPQQQLAVQVASYASAMLLVEGLKRSGHAVSRERLVEALENLYAYETGVTAPVSFGPGRRVGLMGAHVLTVDRSAQRWVPVGEFIQPE